MVRLDTNLKKLLISEIKAGKSINNICSSLKLGKSTAYYYYKKIRGRKYPVFIYKPTFSEAEGEILGIFVGDGSQYYYKPNWEYQTNIHFGNNLDYINYVKSLYISYFGPTWSLLKELTKQGNSKYRLRAHNRAVFGYFSNYIAYDSHSKHDTVKLKTLDLPKPFKIGLLRGILDTDGTISERKSGLRIHYYTTSKVLARQIKILLKEFNIAANIYILKRKGLKDLCEINVLQAGVLKFIKVIQPYKARRWAHRSVVDRPLGDGNHLSGGVHYYKNNNDP